MSKIREAAPVDVPAIVQMIRELAEFEKLAHELEVTEQHLQAALFNESPAVFAVVAETDDGTVAGMAIWFLTFSTFLGRHGIYLEDLIVRPEYRGQGLGTALMRHLAGIANERNYGRFEWAALDWNEKAITLYRKLGAQSLDDWVTFRLTGDEFASSADGREN